MSGKCNDNNTIDALKQQYDKLTEDWRHFNNLIWAVPTVAIAVMTGIMIGAYQNLNQGTWERIASLSIGSFFLLALTIEVVKKRHHMNVISSLLNDLQEELKLKKKFQFPLGISGDIDNYIDKKRNDEGVEFADYKYDPLFKFFAKSYARKFLTYVIFSGAIILAILAEWEFVSHQMIGRWTLVTGATVGIITVTIPVVWYTQEWYKKRPLLSIEVEKESLCQGDEYIKLVMITTKNRKPNEKIFGAIIKCGIFLSDEKKVQLSKTSTDSEDKSIYALEIDKPWDPGKYYVKVGVFVNGYKYEYKTKTFKVTSK